MRRFAVDTHCANPLLQKCVIHLHEDKNSCSMSAIVLMRLFFRDDCVKLTGTRFLIRIEQLSCLAPGIKARLRRFTRRHRLCVDPQGWYASYYPNCFPRLREQLHFVTWSKHVCHHRFICGHFDCDAIARRVLVIVSDGLRSDRPNSTLPLSAFWRCLVKRHVISALYVDVLILPTSSTQRACAIT